MDQRRYSSIAHGELPLWNPVGLDHLQSYISQLKLPAGSNVLDIGCGRGGVLGLLLSQFQMQAVGVDSSPFAIARAARDLAQFVAAGRLTLVERIFDANNYDPASFDLIVCLGSTHAAGGFRQTMRTSKRLLRAKGLLLVGEGYWKREPAADYLSFLGMSPDGHATHAANQSAGSEEGFDIIRHSECSLAEWDAYEDGYAQNVESYVAAGARDPEASAMLSRIRDWRAAYLRWGRETLGFGLYLFRTRLA